MRQERTSRLVLLTLGAGGSMLFAASAAGAQTLAAAGQAGATGQRANVEQTAEAESTSLADPAPTDPGDIVVSATRRSESLQNVPVAVTAITGAMLTSQGVTNVVQLTNSVPSFVGGKSSAIFQPTVRGVGSFGTSPGDEANVALYVDGIYQPDAFTNLLELGEVTQVEVLRGPQGTLFGRNATGGLINVKTPEPSFTPTGAAAINARTIQGGKDAFGGRAQGFVAGPLSQKVAFSVSGLVRRDGGYFYDIAADKKRGRSNDLLIRPKLLFQPSDDVSLQLMGFYRSTRNDAAVQLRPYGTQTLGASRPGVILPIGAWDVSSNDPVGLTTKRYETALTGEFNLGFATLNMATDYQHSRQVQLTDADASNIPLQGVRVDLSSNVVTQEIRLTSPANRKFRWLVGGFGLLLHGKGTGLIYANNTSLIAANLGADAHTASLAGFASVNYDVTPSTTIDAGIRYGTEDRKSLPKLNGVNSFPTGQKVTFDATTYQASIRQRIGSAINTYVTYSTGFKSGVFNSFTSTPAVRPEHNKMLELGFKGRLAEGVRLNVAVFDQRYSNIQVSARLPGSQLAQLLNAAKARQRGIEAEIQLIPIDALHISGQMSYLNAKYRSFPNAIAYSPNVNGNGGLTASTIDATGKRMVRAPKFSTGISATYDIPVSDAAKVVLDGGLFHSSRVYYDFANFFSQKPYTTENLGIALVEGDWRFRAYVTNLSKKAVYQQINPASVAAYVGTQEPRIIGLEVRRTW